MPPPRGVLKAKSAVSSILYSIMSLIFNLLTPNCDVFNHLYPIMHHWCKFGENVSNTLQDIVFTMFRNANTDGRMHARTGQKQYASGHTMLGGGIKMLQKCFILHVTMAYLLHVFNKLIFLQHFSFTCNHRLIVRHDDHVHRTALTYICTRTSDLSLGSSTHMISSTWGSDSLGSE